jgi:hypothetical protein
VGERQRRRRRGEAWDRGPVRGPARAGARDAAGATSAAAGCRESSRNLSFVDPFTLAIADALAQIIAQFTFTIRRAIRYASACRVSLVAIVGRVEMVETADRERTRRC